MLGPSLPATSPETRPAHPAGPAVVLAGMIALYVLVFGQLTWAQHSNFGTFGFDMGIYDQALWLLSRFHDPFVTVRGLGYFGHHVNPLTLLFVPFYWLGAGPHVLYLVETIWLAAGAVPVWLLARDRLEAPWLGLVLAGAYLLYPTVEWINWWHFHPDALAITPLLFAGWLASRHRWGWFAVAVGVALAAKEDVGLAVLVLGLVVAWQSRGDRQGRRVGLLTAGAGLAWFLLSVKVVIPLVNGGQGPFYEDFFPQFGDSSGEILANLVTHPSRLWDVATASDRLTYYEKLLAPVAFLPLGGVASLIALPQLFVNVISGHSYTHDIRFHYSSVVVAGVFLGAVESIARWGRNRVGRAVLVTAVGLAALVGNVLWSPSPLGRDYDTGIWAKANPRHETVNQALDLVPADAGVSATYYLVPHLTHRVHIYEFPNPFEQVYWGVRGENPPDPDVVDYLVLDRRTLGEHQDRYDRLVATDFRVIFTRDDIVVARRR